MSEAEAELSPNLLVTKLFIPPSPANLVLRPRLVQLQNEGLYLSQKLILVSAQARYGKTIPVTEWLNSIQTSTAWLSLDDSGNNPARFLVYLIAALLQIDRRIGENTLLFLQSHPPLPLEHGLTTLCNEIASAPASFLVFDDCHAIAAKPTHKQLNFLVEHQPPPIHLVIVTREGPLLPLARLRVRGQMSEIRVEFVPTEQ